MDTLQLTGNVNFKFLHKGYRWLYEMIQIHNSDETYINVSFTGEG